MQISNLKCKRKFISSRPSTALQISNVWRCMSGSLNETLLGQIITSIFEKMAKMFFTLGFHSSNFSVKQRLVATSEVLLKKWQSLITHTKREAKDGLNKSESKYYPEATWVHLHAIKRAEREFLLKISHDENA